MFSNDREIESIPMRDGWPSPDAGQPRQVLYVGSTASPLGHRDPGASWAVEASHAASPVISPTNQRGRLVGENSVGCIMYFEEYIHIYIYIIYIIYMLNICILQYIQMSFCCFWKWMKNLGGGGGRWFYEAL